LPESWQSKNWSRRYEIQLKLPFGEPETATKIAERTAVKLPHTSAEKAIQLEN